MTYEEQIKDSLRIISVTLDCLDDPSAKLISAHDIQEIQTLFLSVGDKLRKKLPPAGLVNFTVGEF